MTITNTKKVNLDGETYIRVFFLESVFFEDVPEEIFQDWLDAWGHNLK